MLKLKPNHTVFRQPANLWHTSWRTISPVRSTTLLVLFHSNQVWNRTKYLEKLRPRKMEITLAPCACSLFDKGECWACTHACSLVFALVEPLGRFAEEPALWAIGAVLLFGLERWHSSRAIFVCSSFVPASLWSEAVSSNSWKEWKRWLPLVWKYVSFS